MGIIDRLFGSRTKHIVQTVAPPRKIAVGANNSGKEVTITFNDKNITYTGDLASYNYDTILRNKQDNINRLYE